MKHVSMTRGDMALPTKETKQLSEIEQTVSYVEGKGLLLPLEENFENYFS